MNKKTSAAFVLQQLEAQSDAEKKAFLPYFFKTGEGEYGEGDKFLGVVVPKIRIVAKQNKDIPYASIDDLLSSEWHEARMCALLILVMRFAKVDENGKHEIFEYYLAHTAGINNWDLVDLSAPAIVGGYLLDRADERGILYTLVRSDNLWQQRIAMVSTFTFIRHNDFVDTIKLAILLLDHPHDLMHKASGWMLREMGKRNETLLRDFLDQYAKRMPRTMLRYAIEKMEESLRQYYLKSSRTK